ncbi:aldehyde dehydrogenase family 3 member B1 isoform X2 [Lampris incognitus]|uniref:aldehyde dehydrogenase family 3 member B1 isoform X2 n=1 Tax=Lampris incognitus TaxID=2546036 RepID=UPI0024B6038B|nr:aldehyde dehydrogenase family 3 member B1 isoform X2 [Lampris incognitus]
MENQDDWGPSSAFAAIVTWRHPPPVPLLRSLLDRTLSGTPPLTYPPWVTLPGARLQTAYSSWDYWYMQASPPRQGADPGSQRVARIILQAAAIHLTPVTLELGGKCPCLISEEVDILAAAHRLAWAKFFNTGQSCVAPDYVLCSQATCDALLPALQQTLEDFYTKDPQKCPDLGRIISDRHWTRLTDLLQKSQGRVVLGGQSNQSEKYFAPTVIVDVKEDDALMEEEIFGPILPILTIESLEEGISFINRKEKPLALYVFSDKSSVVTKVLEQTSSGGFCSNDGIVHMTLPGLPFGGVGASGWGSYHGRWGFETFSHRRSCMLRGWALERINTLRYPPYQENNLGWLRWTISPKKNVFNNCSLM